MVRMRMGVHGDLEEVYKYGLRAWVREERVRGAWAILGGGVG